jgi:hypothetical protein
MKKIKFSKLFIEKLSYIVAGIFAIFSYIYFFPGLMGGDSTMQWGQVTGEAVISNYHPPIMVYLWKFTKLFFDGPHGLHFVHCLFYWLAISLLANFFSDKNWIKITIIFLLGFFPPIYFWSLHLFKDTGLLVSFAMTLALILNYQKNKCKISYLYYSIIFIYYGIAVRQNALFTGFILLFLVVDLMAQHYKNHNTSKPYINNFFSSFRKAYIIIASVITILTFLVNNVGVMRFKTFGTVYLWDLAAISVQQNKMLLPREVIIDKSLTDEQILELLKTNYSPNRCNGIYLPTNFLLYGQTKIYWGTYIDAIFKYPKSYLSHRYEFTKYFLGISYDSEKGYYYHLVQDKELLEKRENSSFFKFFGINKDLTESGVTNNQTFIKVFSFSEAHNYLIFSSYFYILLFLFLLGTRFFLSVKNLAPKIDIKSNSIIIFISGLLYIVPLLFFAPAEDYRYTIWFVFSAIISSMLLVKESLGKK